MPMTSDNVAPGRSQAASGALNAKNAKALALETNLPEVSSCAVVRIDDQPYRNGALEELKKLQKSLLRIHREIERHKSIVRPSYHTWHQENFGRRVQSLALLRVELEEKTLLVRRMQDHYAWHGMTRQKALERATSDLRSYKRRMEQLEREEAQANEAAAKQREFHAQKAEEDLQTIATIDATELEEDLGVKYYYRKLARALHPDRLGEHEEMERLLWQETQDAYQAADVDRLKLLWNECVVQMDPASGELTLADLKSALSRLGKRFRAAQHEKLELAKTDPSWAFDKKDKTDLAREITTDLDETEAELTQSIRALNLEISAFSRSHVRPEAQGRWENFT